MRKRIRRFLFLFSSFFFFKLPTKVTASTSGWIVESSAITYAYNEFPLDNYQLDLFYDPGSAWLPWNLGDNVADMLFSAINGLSNLFFGLNNLLSYFVGYLMEQAFSMDFVSDLLNEIQDIVQSITGFDGKFASVGLVPSLIAYMILFVGIYLVVVGALKKQVTKALQMVLNFTLILMLLLGYATYTAPLLGMINDFSKDVSSEMLRVTTKILYPNKKYTQEQSVRAIREQMFDLMIKKPYLILQYGTADEDTIGKKRIESILSKSPHTKGKEREEAAKKEVEVYKNTNMSPSFVFQRLGMVLLILIVNIILGVCSLILSALKISFQIQFLVYAIFLSVALVRALLPNSYQIGLNFTLKTISYSIKAIGITIMTAILFLISGILYRVVGDGSGYLMVVFTQIVGYVMIMMKTHEYLGLFDLTNNSGKNSDRPSALKTAAGYMLARKALNGMFGRGNQRRKIPPKKLSNESAMTTETRSNVDEEKRRSLGEHYDEMKDYVKDIPLNAKLKGKKFVSDVKQYPEKVRENYKDKTMENELKREQGSRIRAKERNAKRAEIRKMDLEERVKRRGDLAVPQVDRSVRRADPLREKRQLKPSKKEYPFADSQLRAEHAAEEKASFVKKEAEKRKDLEDRKAVEMARLEAISQVEKLRERERKGEQMRNLLVRDDWYKPNKKEE